MYTPQNPLIQCNETQQCTTFYSIDRTKNLLATAELSTMPWMIVKDEFQHSIPSQFHDKNWYYFNRIKKPDGFTPKHIALLLYKEIARWADFRQINIWNDISPYGHLTAEQIYTVEHLFGFQKIHDEYITVRLENYAY
jgi:hypothetical protein